MENLYKIVHFDTYCKKCKHSGVPEELPPCDECLYHPVNLHSHKPIKFEEAKRHG